VRALKDQLASYAAYHRDRRNIAIHSIGIPLIVLAVAALLSRPRMQAGPLPISPAVLVFGLAVLFYLRLDTRFGLVMTLVAVAGVSLGAWSAGQSTATWLALGVGLFAFGWTLQFIGHYWEGRKPAFVDDITGLIIGPLFVVAEAAFALGLRKEVQTYIESKAGPIRHTR
jgi:uncharacterized membrane protein YGL010W